MSRAPSSLQGRQSSLSSLPLQLTALWDWTRAAQSAAKLGVPASPAEQDSTGNEQEHQPP